MEKEFLTFRCFFLSLISSGLFQRLYVSSKPNIICDSIRALLLEIKRLINEYLFLSSITFKLY